MFKTSYLENDLFAMQEQSKVTGCAEGCAVVQTGNHSLYVKYNSLISFTLS